jgi:hypothetical protein
MNDEHKDEGARSLRRAAWIALGVAAGLAGVGVAVGRVGGAAGALAVGGLAWVFIRAHVRYHAFHYAYFLRIPAGLYLFTLFLPLLAVGVWRDFLGNLMVLAGREAIWVGVGIGILVFAQAVSARLIVRATGSRVDLPLERGKPVLAQAAFDYKRGWPLIALAPGLVWGLVLVWSTPSSRVGTGAAFVLPLLAAYGFFWLLFVKVGAMLERAAAPGSRHRRWRAFLNWFERWPRVDRGYRDHAREHLALAVMLAVSAFWYGFGWLALEPPAPRLPSFPAVAYVLTLLLVLSWALPAFSFALDKYRLPILLVVLPAWLVLHQIAAPDHHYQLQARPPAIPEPPSATALLAERLGRSVEGGGGQPLVVVMASGGGITASLWTATVLAHLQSQTELGDAFARSIGLVSTTSGGSVGAMFYVGGYRSDAVPAAWRSAEAAATSSLAATAWGMVYPDFVRSVTGFFPLDRAKSRGWANEQVWFDLGAKATLAEWSLGVRDHWRPLQVFNATEVETGTAVRLSAVHLEGAPGTSDPLCCDPSAGPCAASASDRGIHWSPVVHDMRVTTAARLSATFPYVTPVARGRLPDGRPCGNHLADGGYFDNYGVHSAVDLLNRALASQPRAEGAPRPRILLVQIEAFPPSAAAEPIAGWKAISLGPVLTLLGVRSASQADRNRTELDLFSQRWSQEAVIERFRFVLAPRKWPTATDRAELVSCPIEALRRQCGSVEPAGDQPMRAQDLPTSWQLTCAEKRAIVCHWQRDPGIGKQLADLKRVYAGMRAQSK